MYMKMKDNNFAMIFFLKEEFIQSVDQWWYHKGRFANGISCSFITQASKNQNHRILPWIKGIKEKVKT